ncbi:hypothetical protein CRUP_033955 [Coryphaenoides rupestris]|nr:hypothetical protein CRUP_033955 [Coryphaenoides rupestris]
MEGRCSVETWLQLPYAPRNAIGGLGAAGSLGVMGGLGVICDGSEELHVFHVEDKRIVASPCDVMTCLFSVVIYYIILKCLVVPLPRSPSSSLVPCAALLIVTVTRIYSTPPSSPPVLTVSSDWLAVGEEGVCSLLLVGSVLLTLIQKEQQWLFSLYSVLPAAAGGSPAGRHQRAGLLELPVLSTGLVGGEPGGRPVMKCVQSSDEAVASSASSSSRGDGHLLLDSLLFRVLFGADAALARSPMILCGLPDGRLCSFPLCGLPSPRLSILHSLDQPLVFIGTSVTTGTDPSPPRCLVVVGGLGRVVLIRAGEMTSTSTSTTTSSSTTTAGRRLAAFTEGSVSGPVVCCWADGRRLYYSTGSDLLALDLSGGPGQRGGGATAPHGDGGEGEAGGGGRGRLPGPISLNVCGVTALSRITHTPDAAAEVELHSMLLSAFVGVLHISGLLLSNHSPGDRRPIRCRSVCGWSRALRTDTLSLACVLHNASLYALEEGWTLCLTLIPLAPPLDRGGERPSRTYSFPFRNLRPGGEFEVSLPLAAAGDASFPMTLGCSLVFTLTALLEGAELGQLLASDGHGGGYLGDGVVVSQGPIGSRADGQVGGQVTDL